MLEFAPICIYLVISSLVPLIPPSVPFPSTPNGLTHPEKLSAHKCGFDPSGDARNRFDTQSHPVPTSSIISNLKVTSSSPWAVPPNKIDSFGSRPMMVFSLISTIGFPHEWKKCALDRE